MAWSGGEVKNPLRVVGREEEEEEEEEKEEKEKKKKKKKKKKKRKIKKKKKTKTTSFVMSVRPFVHMQQFGSHWKDFMKIGT